MPIRRATPADFPAINAVCAAAFHDDELFGDMIHPLRDQYPEDFVHFFARRNRENWWDYAHEIWVATVIENGKEKIAGMGEWERMGRANEGWGIGWWDPRQLLKPAQHHLNTLSGRIWPNRAAKELRLENAFVEAHPFFHHHWSGARADSWYLDLLAIHPAYQGRGLGKELVAYGMRRAKRDGVCCSVVASRIGEKFYLTCGFDTPVGWATEGEGNPLKGAAGGRILFRDADELEKDEDEVWRVRNEGSDRENERTK
ncbi:hypothetical protein W97_06019 [Coniosporium apollinis CBS 100218]|uniref:N-acetyltransferase domain-containing protein n=1 Tax=Coniosporium apollinis (strain CBS 100218) TaxID=1168221 RepID=R7YYN6_CONA1|nr:uncharacterized protein W97_06019 [Coniosporium apollinis CBS 100218]EON66771.1 hypothetical protein W97_06019 [Coniosporium apollinis CBS 100218]